MAQELHRLRVLAGLSGRELGRRIGMSQSTVSRIEAGRSVPSVPEVAAWTSAVAASAEAAQMLIAFAELAVTEVHHWDAVLAHQPHLQTDVHRRESAARRITVFQTSVVPGLLQTAEYARGVLSLAEPAYSPGDLAAATAARLERQSLLYDEDRQFCFLIAEAALRWRLGTASTHRGQLDRIIALSTLCNVEMGVIPLDTPASTVLSHGFVLYEGENADEEASVEVETIHANLIVREAAHVRLYRQRCEALTRMGMFGDDARRFLAALAAQLDATRAVPRNYEVSDVAP